MRRTRLLVPVLVAAAVLTAGVAIISTPGPRDAVIMIAVTVALAGAYLLRHYARATLIYRRRRPPLPTDGHAPAARPPSPTGDNIPRGPGPSAPDNVAKPRAPLAPPPR